MEYFYGTEVNEKIPQDPILGTFIDVGVGTKKENRLELYMTNSKRKSSI
jgi:hypothetical protein